MGGPVGSLFNPVAECFDLCGGEGGVVRVGGRHFLQLIVAGHAAEQLTGADIARNDRCVVPQIGHDALRGIQPQVSLTRGVIRAVTLKAFVREDREHVSTKVDGRGTGLCYCLCGSALVVTDICRKRNDGQEEPGPVRSAETWQELSVHCCPASVNRWLRR